MKFLNIFWILFVGCIGSKAQTNLNARQILPFNDSWSFIKDDRTEYKNSAFNDEKWRKVNLPHDFTIEGEFNKDAACGASGAFLEGGVAWYRKTFELPEFEVPKSISITFDGIYMNSQVWVNDTYLGLYPYGYSQIVYDLSGIVKLGQKNTIVVRVDNSHEPSARYYAGAGIYRNVCLTISNQTRFDHTTGVFVSYKNVSDKSAIVQCAYDIVSMAFEGSEFEWWRQNSALNIRIRKEFTIRSEIIDRNGKIVSSANKAIELSDFSETKAFMDIKVDNPTLWSAESPNLYTLRSSILSGGALIDMVNTSIGIRSLEYSASKGMLINGKQVKLKGVCMHQDAGALGSATTKDVWVYRLEKLKKMGANAIRTSHNPFSKEFYEVCDSLGFYVMDEAFDEWNLGYDFKTNSNPGGKMKYGYHLYFNQWAETDLKAMIQRDRNSPCVVMYSIGNEIPNQLKASGLEVLKKLQQVCHQLDSTRMVTAGCDLVAYAEENGFLSTLDIAGYNYIGRYTSEKMYQPVKEKFPNRLFVGTETYYDDYYWMAVRDNDYVIGEFIWAGFDYLGEGIAWPKRGWDACLIDMAGSEYPEYYHRKSFWSDEPIVHIGVRYADKPQSEWHPRPLKSHWNWKWNANYLNQVYVYSNCDEVEVLVNNVSVEKKPVDKNDCFAVFMLPYNYGEIKAIGYIKGVPVKNHILTTAGSAKQFNAVCSKNTIKANNEDVAIIELNAVDEKGIPVYDFNADVSVEVSGDLELIGMDCANQRSHEQYKKKSRKAFNGRLLFTVKAGSKKGNATIRFLSPNMITKEVHLILQ